MKKIISYVREPDDKASFTKKYDRYYTSFASIYDQAVKLLPFWKRWLKATLPYIHGPRVLEVSFGTGYLILQFAGKYETYGIDYNTRFVSMVGDKLRQAGLAAHILQGDVEALPYEDATFDTIVNTMAFTAYPDGEKALAEMLRVLKNGGQIVMVDVGFPKNLNRLGVFITRAWIAAGDIVRDMHPLFKRFDLEYTHQEIGGFGSVHLYVARKR